MKIATVICAIFTCIGSATGQALDPFSFHILKVTEQIETSDDLAPTIAADIIPWRDAIRIAASSRMNKSSERISIVRLMEAALIPADVDMNSVSLDRLTNSDIMAMRKAVGFPGACDILLYLLNRGPSLRDEFGYEEYIVQRFFPTGEPARLREKASRPYLGVESEFKTTIFDPEDDLVCRNPGEYAKTLRLNLAALPHLVLAAKAYRAAERAPQDRAIYPLLIASHAVNRMFEINRKADFRPLVYFAELKTMKALRAYTGNDPFLIGELRSIESRVADTAFAAQLFKDAAIAYTRAQVSMEDQNVRVSAAWGRAISLFAYGAPGTGLAFDGVINLINSDTRHYAILFGLLLNYLPADEAVRLGDVTSWRERLTETLGTELARLVKLPELAPENDFLNLMVTIGRPDIASRFLIDRIYSVKGTPREDWYLRRLAAFINDYYYMISFQLSPARGWVRRETEGYNALLDFLDNFNPERRLVGRGEVVVSDGSYIPYSALTPEEDRATTFTVYGIFSEHMLLQFDKEIVQRLDMDNAVIISGFEEWVRRAMSRIEPAPSIIPYLKLVFHEWFFQAFGSLKNPSIDASKFRYSTIDASFLTTPDRVKNLLQHPAATSHHENLIELFLQTRMFLEEMYP